MENRAATTQDGDGNDELYLMGRTLAQIDSIAVMRITTTTEYEVTDPRALLIAAEADGWEHVDELPEGAKASDVDAHDPELLRRLLLDATMWFYAGPPEAEAPGVNQFSNSSTGELLMLENGDETFWHGGTTRGRGSS